MGRGDGVSVLTVGDTFILDLQILVGSGAGVREYVRAGYHHALGPVITPRYINRQKSKVLEHEQCWLLKSSTNKKFLMSSF